MKNLQRINGPISRLRIIVCLTFAGLILTNAEARQRETPPGRPSAEERESLFHRSWMPFEAWKHVDAVGERLHTPGKEHSVFVGNFTDGAGTRPITMTHQLPRLMRIVGVASGGRALSFDGGNAPRGLSLAEQDLVETLAMDTVEGLLSALKEGAAVRLIGRDFRPDLRPAYTGPRYDIFEVTATIPTRPDRVVRAKRYYFNSQTGLLAFTRYYDRVTSRAVEIRFSNWGNAVNSNYPVRIERYEDGKPVFSLQFASVGAGPRQDVAVFRNP